MTLADLIRGRRKTEAVGFASAIPAIPAIRKGGEGGTIARIATIAIANPGGAKTEGGQTAPLLWRVAILDPGGRAIEVDTPSGMTMPEWRAYAERYHGPGCSVTPIAGPPKPRAPANLDEALAAACEG